jgi:hypothetical protein
MAHHNRNHPERLKDIINKQRPVLYDYLNAIVNESKVDRNYANAEAVFELFLKHLNYAVPLRPQKQYLEDEVNVFQKSIATMIRYAPSPQKALDYSSYMLSQPPPLRTEFVETTCLINLIFVYRVAGSPDAMDKALELIRVGLDRKVYNLKAHRKYERDNVAEVFFEVSGKVVAYHHLQFSADKKTLEPCPRPRRPQRFSTY